MWVIVRLHRPVCLIWLSICQQHATAGCNSRNNCSPATPANKALLIAKTHTYLWVWECTHAICSRHSQSSTLRIRQRDKALENVSVVQINMVSCIINCWINCQWKICNISSFSPFKIFTHTFRIVATRTSAPKSMLHFWNYQSSV